MRTSGPSCSTLPFRCAFAPAFPSYIIRRADSRVEFSAEFNERTEIVFHEIRAQRLEIEQAYGRPLYWQERRERKILRVQEIIEGGFLSPESAWPAIQEKLIDAMIRLEKAFRPFLEHSQS
jgi:hypothetical protein